MEEYIKNLRSRGYSGWIQVFRRIEKHEDGNEFVSWMKMNEPIARQVSPEFKLIEIFQFFDFEKKLDYLDFIFEKSKQKKLTVKEHKKDTKEKIERTNEYYWKPIRKIIGNEKILAIGVNSFIQNEKGEIAAAKRKDDGNWSFPAGAREIGELPSESIVNEMREETSLTAKIERLCCLYTVPLVYPNGDHYDYLIALYKMKIVEGDLKVNDDENLDVRWMEIEEAKKLFTGGWRKRLDFYLNYNEDNGVILL